ncbi:MAG TPA: zinc ribbon domain-containing protein [Mycobacteriales bacterium]|nr:zinc ribbon domain-containing protein [Mycobacteriales bacterium]
MAAYEYRCRVCDAGFTVQRAMSDVATLVRCPAGHEDVARVWSAVAVTGSASAPSPAPRQGGGCCGGGCCG